MAEANKANLLVVAGVHDESSLGWSAAEAWLARNENNQVLATVRNDRSLEFVIAMGDEFNGRVGFANPIDWTANRSIDQLNAQLTEWLGESREVSGVVHSVAWAPPENFTDPAHKLSASVYEHTARATAFSLINLIRGTKRHLEPSAGIITFGFGEYGRTIDEYGPALSVAKVALSHLIKELAVSLGQEDPPARTAEIVTGFIPTYAGRGVLAGIGKKRGKRLKIDEEEAYVARTSALRTANSDEQRTSAGLLAASFIADPMWRQTTGQRLEVNAGWSLISRPITPGGEE